MNVRDSLTTHSNNSIFRRLGFGLLLITYLVCAFFLPILNQTDYLMEILFLSIRSNSFCGILSEIQIVVLMSYVSFYGKKGLITSFCLAGISLISSIMPIIRYQRLNSIAGIFMIFIALVVNVIIYSNQKTLRKQTDELERYNKNLNDKQKSLHKLAYYDYLTNIPNRRNIVEKITSLCSQDNKTEFKLVVIDIKSFKKINDVAGHQKGDSFLKQLVSNWRILLKEGDILGRIDGDEFILIIPRKISNEALALYLNEFKLAINNHIPFSGMLPWQSDNEASKQALFISANFGVVSYPEHGKNAEELMQFADTALAVSKECGPNTIRHFSKSMYEALLKKTIMESSLSGAIENNECSLVFQPQYEADTKRLRGFETLVRWENKDLGKVPPSIFIPLAEDTGFILTLGDWIMTTALQNFSDMLSEIPSDIVLSVNLSVMQLLHPQFMDSLKRILAETKFPPTQLELEITESIFINAKEEVVALLNEIKSLGIQIALDDFGTGYSSLSYIKDLPLDVLKIDKTFVDTISEDIKKAQLVDTILAIAKQLDCKVVAEGVETLDQLSYLKERSCDYIQGYLWGKPMPLEHATGLLSQRSELIS